MGMMPALLDMTNSFWILKKKNRTHAKTGVQTRNMSLFVDTSGTGRILCPRHVKLVSMPDTCSTRVQVKFCSTRASEHEIFSLDNIVLIELHGQTGEHGITD